MTCFRLSQWTGSIILSAFLTSMILAGCTLWPGTPAAPRHRVHTPPPPPKPVSTTISDTRDTSATQIPDATVSLDTLRVHMLYASEAEAINFMLEGTATLTGGNGQQHVLNSGVWRLQAMDIRPARQRHHVFPKTFKPGEESAMHVYMNDWRNRGYDPQIEVFGKQLRVGAGRIVDNRIFWISVARVGSAGEAEALQQRFSREEQVWAWTRPETIAPGSATIAVVNASGNTITRLTTPLRIETNASFHVAKVDSGFWSERRDDRVYLTPVTLDVGPSGSLELSGEIPVEEYLRGVLPAEMPASWPAEALKAQAVAARSEVLAALAGKHRLEGYDFCATECCRAYRGLAGHQPSTDLALRATQGEAIVYAGAIVPTVYSSSCGGWTEHNEHVWSGPLNPVLRGHPDRQSSGGESSLHSSDAVRRWLAQGGNPAYCSGSQDYRWSRTLSVREMSDHVNRMHRVGTVQRLEGETRGVSGRLRSLRVVGSEGTVTLERELNIRRAFGGLPSALFVWHINSNGSYTFQGAGRGHGVGLCQHGARGMADRGIEYRQILTHYFTGVQIERILQ